MAAGPVGVGLGNRLDRMEVAIQNLTHCMANLVDSKQAAGVSGPIAKGRDPSRGKVIDCHSSIPGGLTHSLGVPTCVGLGVASHGRTRSLRILADQLCWLGEGARGYSTALLEIVIPRVE